MQLKDVMTRDVEVVHPNAPLQDVARKMDSLDVGALPVCDGERLQGMVTDRDIVIRAIATGADPKTTPVNKAMSQQLVYCFEDQDVRDAARMMQEKQIRRLPVLNREKRLVGIVSLGDLAVETGNDRLSGETLERVSEPAQPDRHTRAA